MIKLLPTARATIEDVIQHKWLTQTGEEVSEEELQAEYDQRIALL